MSSYSYTKVDEQDFSVLLGKTLLSIVVIKDDDKYSDADDELIFLTDDYVEYVMYHEQDCCEHVYIEDICGDIDDLLNSQILLAEESSNHEDADNGSETWTFYKISTIKGSVTIRWCGRSNGYYSESVRFAKRLEKGEIQ